jgi:hypothetical protein
LSKKKKRPTQNGFQHMNNPNTTRKQLATKKKHIKKIKLKIKKIKSMGQLYILIKTKFSL